MNSETSSRSDPGSGSQIFTFLKDGSPPLQIKIHEIYSPEYALFTWPAAPVLAQYVWFNQHLFFGKTVLEIGCGTALPGLTAAKAGAQVILADRHSPQSRQLVQRNLSDNGFSSQELCVCDWKDKRSVILSSLTWACFEGDIVSLPVIDFVLASDCFYDEKDFESIVTTISYLLKVKGGKDSCCLLTYQMRNSEWNIGCLLQHHGLKGEEIALDRFEASSHQLLGSKLPGFHSISLFRLTSTD